ncbi:MAG: MbnP family protein [Bacteroidota bacterium]
MKRFLILLVLSSAGFISAQTSFKVYFTPKVDYAHFALNQVLTDDNGKKMSIDHFNYYISHIHLIHDGGQDLDLSDTVFLVKHDNFLLDLGLLNITSPEKIRFGVGVPQELSHLDISQYPENHPLSYQAPSMQWGWAAGYMHMIVGGNADSNDDEVPDAYFELHNLGDQNYYEIELDVTATTETDGSKSIYIDCNLDTWLGTTDLGTNGVKHGETGANFTVMKNVILRPVFTASVNAGLTENNKTGEALFFKNANGNFLKWSEMNDLQEIRLIDIQGKVLFQQDISGSAGELELGRFKSGTYFAQFYDRSNTLLNGIKLAL